MHDNKEEETTTEADVMVVAGGAIKGLSMLGAIQYAKDENYLKNIHTMVGTSVGSILIYFLAIGYNPIEILIKIISHKVIERLNASMNLTRALGEGVLEYSHIQEVLEKMTIDKIGYFPTLKDVLVKFEKKLVMTTYNLTKDQIEYLTPDTHPELPCLTAIRMSSNIPFMFEQFKYMGCYYIDGGVADNFSIDMGLKCGKKVMGFYTEEAASKVIDPKKGVVSYIIHLLWIMYRIRLKEIMQRNQERCMYVKIIDDIPMLNFNLTLKEKLELFSLGYTSAKKCFSDEVVTIKPIPEQDLVDKDSTLSNTPTVVVEEEEKK